MTADRSPGACSAPDCEREVTRYRRAALCTMHYLRLHRTGTLERHYQRNAGLGCAAPGCDLAAEVKGLCATHYLERLRTGVAVDQLGWDAQPRDPCSRCGDPVHARGLCDMHYRAYRASMRRRRKG